MSDRKHRHIRILLIIDGNTDLLSILTSLSHSTDAVSTPPGTEFTVKHFNKPSSLRDHFNNKLSLKEATKNEPEKKNREGIAFR